MKTVLFLLLLINFKLYSASDNISRPLTYEEAYFRFAESQHVKPSIVIQQPLEPKYRVGLLERAVLTGNPNNVKIVLNLLNIQPDEITDDIYSIALKHAEKSKIRNQTLDLLTARKCRKK